MNSLQSPFSTVHDRLFARIVGEEKNRFLLKDDIDYILTRDTIGSLLEFIDPEKINTSIDQILWDIESQGIRFLAGIILAQQEERLLEFYKRGKIKDTNLSISEEQIRAITNNATAARNLYEKLRIVSALAMHKNHHVYLDTDLDTQLERFPIIRQDQDSMHQGQNSSVSKVTIPLSHIFQYSNKHHSELGNWAKEKAYHKSHNQSIKGETVKCIQMVQKEMHLTDMAINELRILKEFQRNPHESIVPLFWSCQNHESGVNSRLYLFFPLYHHRLSDLLKLKPSEKVPGLTDWSSEELFQALSSLAEGLHNVHEMKSSTSDIQWVGSHNDLKPDNIMVDNDNCKFILIDFGFAILKRPVEGSNDEAAPFASSYTAPEVYNQEQSSGRKRDMWVFGCILLEILLYKERPSPDTINNFTSRRKHKEYGRCTSWFYLTNPATQSQTLHPEVDSSLLGLEESVDSAIGNAGRIIREILIVEPPEKRLSAKDVAVRLKETRGHDIQNIERVPSPVLSEQSKQRASDAQVTRVSKSAPLDLLKNPQTLSEGNEHLLIPDSTSSDSSVPIRPYLREAGVGSLHSDAPTIQAQHPANASTQALSSTDTLFKFVTAPNSRDGVPMSSYKTETGVKPYANPCEVDRNNALERIGSLNNREKGRLRALWNRIQHGDHAPWARSTSSRVLIAYNKSDGTVRVLPILTAFIVRDAELHSRLHEKCVVVYHFLSKNTSAKEVARNLFDQLQSIFRSRRWSSFHDEQPDLTSAASIMHAFITLYNNMPHETYLVVVVAETDRCVASEGDMGVNCSEIIMPLVDCVYNKYNSPGKNGAHCRRASLKLLATVTSEDYGKSAADEWNISLKDRLLNMIPQGGDPDPAIAVRYFTNNKLEWCNVDSLNNGT